MKQGYRNHSAGARHQRGVVAVIVGILLVVLIGAVGLAVDLGKLFVAKTELQNGADVCALAASRELTGTSSNQLTIAEAAGIAAGSRNQVIFQHEAINVDVDSSVTFSEAFTGPYQPKGAFTGADILAVEFVRCTVERTDIPNWLIGVLNLLPDVNVVNATVRATAVASLQSAQTNCAIPIMLCGNDPATASAVRGTWLSSVISPHGRDGQELQGAFNWADLTGDTGTSDIGALLTGSGVCNLPSEGTEISAQGERASLARYWNSRFGIYSGSVRPPTNGSGEGVPDFTGYAYTHTSWASGFGAFDDFVSRRSANASYQGDAATGLVNTGTARDQSFLRAYGADRRLATVPVVDACGHYARVQSWACVLMLHPLNTNARPSDLERMYVEYLGAADDPASPCATLGLPGSDDSAGPRVPVLVQ